MGREEKTTNGNFRIAAICGPCIGDAGYETVDVAGDAGWKELGN